MANQDIRLLAKGSGVPFWKICLAMGISEPTLTRKLRNELPDEEKNRIREIIKQLAAEGE